LRIKHYYADKMVASLCCQLRGIIRVFFLSSSFDFHFLNLSVWLNEKITTLSDAVLPIRARVNENSL